MELKLKHRSAILNLSAQGVTLIELMVAMTVALVVLGGMYISYRTQQRSYMVQEEVAVMQQNLRAAMFYLQRDIRLAGYNFTLQEVNPVGILSANATSFRFSEDLNQSGAIDAGEDIHRCHRFCLPYRRCDPNGTEPLIRSRFCGKPAEHTGRGDNPRDPGAQAVAGHPEYHPVLQPAEFGEPHFRRQ
jgi:prepilin-type N-terminal cleavage/methylation domain-containing protein